MFFECFFNLFLSGKTEEMLLIFGCESEWVQHVKIIENHRKTVGFCRFFTCWRFVAEVENSLKIIPFAWKTPELWTFPVNATKCLMQVIYYNRKSFHLFRPNLYASCFTSFSMDFIFFSISFILLVFRVRWDPR